MEVPTRPANMPMREKMQPLYTKLSARLATGKPGWNMCPPGAPQASSVCSLNMRAMRDWEPAAAPAAPVGASRYMSAKLTMEPTWGLRGEGGGVEG